MAQVLNRGREPGDGGIDDDCRFRRMGVPAIPSSLILCIVATRQGYPSARCARPGLGPAATRGTVSVTREWQTMNEFA